MERRCRAQYESWRQGWEEQCGRRGLQRWRAEVERGMDGGMDWSAEHGNGSSRTGAERKARHRAVEG